MCSLDSQMDMLRSTTVEVPSTFTFSFCHRKAKDFIILTVLHTHQVRTTGPWPALGEAEQGLRALWETEVGPLETPGDHLGSSTEVLDWCLTTPRLFQAVGSESCHSPTGSV